MLTRMRTISVIFCLSLFSGYCFAVVNNCTIYVSSSGGGSGTTVGSPTTLAGANSASVPGSVICLEGGTYSLAATFLPNHSGTASNYITWIAYGDSPANFVWTGGAGANNGTGRQMIASNSSSYVKYIGFYMDGQQYANSGVLCNGGHHVVYQNLYVKNLIYSGLESSNCDYMTADHNLIWHVGENPNTLVTIGGNAGSGITWNQQTLFDTYPGLHNVISNNIISGLFDPTSAHTDGNGISLDLTNQSTSGATLVVNNVVFGNGGRGMDVGSTSPNFWTNVYFINNTAYMNSLDLTSLLARGNYEDLGSKNVYFVNNISYAWPGWSGLVPNYRESNSPTGTFFYTDLWFNGVEDNFTPPDPTQFLHGDPLFLNPPKYDLSGGGGYANSIDPATLGTDLTLQAGSPARGTGVDPSTISGIPSQALTDMQPYIYVDINGNSRPHSGQDLGAYQSGAAPSPPTGLTATVN